MIRLYIICSAFLVPVPSHPFYTLSAQYFYMKYIHYFFTLSAQYFYAKCPYHRSIGAHPTPTSTNMANAIGYGQGVIQQIVRLQGSFYTLCILYIIYINTQNVFHEWYFCALSAQHFLSPASQPWRRRVKEEIAFLSCKNFQPTNLFPKP